ncbi:DUF647-domain-containing protein [Dendrothele bispora CBS 962.96]|uniref:DUF647-domain-containing protein n=1 Tax=Dendrothele bispora (strain CBS 962.96) TaxID=1314807 RepID=A0A4S8LE05_DENBC|nr:DUF647-domain-containing protein [Dendrothele bispora CBS 962.96]
MDIIERDESGRVNSTRIVNHQISRSSNNGSEKRARTRSSATEILSKVFLPVGYPRSVSPDYLRYQILNSLQAFCSSLAGLLSSRATLEGYGVGKASASATNALILSIMQDMFARLTTIISAYYLGSSLFPEAKTYRFLADILNDAAIILDTTSPMLATVFPFHLLATSRIPFQLYTLCISASLRSLCGIAAGGSKTAITMHFATPLEGSGDVGDLNAKDSSKETVLGLLGMLLGTITVPYLTTTWSTYTVLFLLVFLHLLINYYGVRGIVLRTLNRHRASLAWAAFRHDFGEKKKNEERSHESNPSRVLTPSSIASYERLFDRPDLLWDIHASRTIGRCTMGSSIGLVFDVAQADIFPATRLFDLFRNKSFVVWFDPKDLTSTASSSEPSLRDKHSPHVHVFLKENHTPSDQLKAWLISCEVALLLASQQLKTDENDEDASVSLDALVLISRAKDTVDRLFSTFTEQMLRAGWCADTNMQNKSPENDEGNDKGSQPCLAVALMTRPPQTVVVDVSSTEEEAKKDR